MTTARRTAVALAAIVVVVVVALAGVFDAAASTPTAAHPRNVVAVITVDGGQVVGTHPDVLPGQRRARAPGYDQTAVGSSVAAETEGTTAALQEHLSGAVERFNAEGLTEAQKDALIDNPGLEQAFRGQRIDSFFKESLNNAIESGTDSRLGNLYVTRSGEFGPDVFDLGSMNRWWDVTTEGSWAGHVAKYANPFGEGIPLFTP